jgi:hypothetical protein
MPDARLHFRSPAWQSLPVAGLPPATWPEPARRLRSFFDRRIPLQALYQPARTSNVHGQAAIISEGSDNILERSDDGSFCDNKEH